MSRIICHAKTDIGLKRSNNEDAYIINPGLGFLAVADGMGGVEAGEIASKIFIDTAMEVFSKPGLPTHDSHELVRNSFLFANERILNCAKDKKYNKGMGCTAELIAFYKGNFVLGHVGDSSTYFLRQKQFIKLTHDHSFVQEQIDNGIITREEARNHTKRNIILRAVGVGDKLAVDFIKGHILPGDLFLLCSDGLTGMVADPDIKKILSSANTLSEKADELINSANSAGGNDNITIALCEIVS